ncbi:MAG TPA: septal ring lytic transglycosylase RlpA family protein [Candidatus Binatia bacterium]|nr:septal ring lytic transglycosylase RlpA family protein [Candidatus Binatia bacterium]
MLQKLKSRPTFSLEQPGSRRLAILSLMLWSFFVACSLPPSRVKVPAPSASQSRASQTGIASWYGPGFHGKTTASGTIYDQNDFTAAHQTLPLGTRVMVTNLENGSSTEVTINDRGPFAKGRIIDLSFAAGKVLGMIGPGTIPVQVEVIDGGPHRIQSIPSSLDYTLQLGSFSQLENAQQLRDRLAASYGDVAIVPLLGQDGTYYRVQLGTFSSRNAAEARARQLSEAGFPVVIMEK